MSAYLQDSGIRREMPEIIKIGLCFELNGKTYNLRVEVDKKNPSIWMMGVSEDFDKEDGRVQYYVSKHLGTLAREDEYDCFKDLSLKEVFEGFNTESIDLKKVIQSFSNKITDKILKDKINNIVNSQGDVDINHIGNVNEHLVQNYNVQCEEMVNIINYLRIEKNLTKVQREKVNRYIDSFENNAENFLRQVPKRHMQKARVLLKDYQNKVYKTMLEYIKSNINSNKVDGQEDALRTFDARIKKLNDEFFLGAKGISSHSEISSAAFKLTTFVVNVCALCTFGFLHLVNKGITGKFGFYMQPKAYHEAENFSDTIQKSNQNVSGFLANQG